jgi:hypothetical protein
MAAETIVTELARRDIRLKQTGATNQRTDFQASGPWRAALPAWGRGAETSHANGD